MKKLIFSLLVLLGLMVEAKAQNDTPLTFEAIAAGTVTFVKEGDFTPNSGIQYRLGETGDWLSYSYGTGITLQAGDKLQFRSTSSNAYSKTDGQYSHFTCTADCYLYGSVGALFNNSNSLPRNACSRMFYGNTHIKNRTGKSLVLPATTLAQACYDEMFSGCTALTTAPALPATSLAEECYYRMFYGCTALTTAPELPAHTLANGCYTAMFSRCTTLTTAPELPATSLANDCYSSMFFGCTTLTTAPELSATSLAEECYVKMFSGCTALVMAPALPATSLAEECYSNMFDGCTALTMAPELPAHTLANGCYTAMFSSCTALTTAPALPATSLAVNCYHHMFSYCTALTAAPALPATSLANNCYRNMFSGCTALTTAPALPATILAQSCYYYMFSDCTNLTEAPVLPATTLVSECYNRMFKGCTHLNHVTCLATDISASNCTSNWLNNVAASGTFVKAPAMENWTTGISGIPQGWTVDPYSMTFQAIDAGTVTFVKEGDFTPNSGIQYRLGEAGDWLSYSYGTGISLQAGDKLQFRSTSSDAYAIDGNRYSHFTCTADCYLYGNVGALFNNASSLPGNACSRMFYGNTHIKNRTDKSLVLPATTLNWACYEEMFSGCTALTTAPELPATSLADECYREMFSGCTTLTAAPALPATTLARACYEEMFSGCTALTTAPALPATSLAEECYYRIFYGCTALTTAPELPAHTLANGCYTAMFYLCTALVTAPALPATSLADECYKNMFSGCTALTTAPALPATSLAGWCYQEMFSGCTALTAAPALPATSLAEYCYYNMFEGCTNLTEAPELPAATLVSGCYYQMFKGCTRLNYMRCLATDISANYCTTEWLNNVAATGTFFSIFDTPWTTGDSGIPQGWTVVDNNPNTDPLTFQAVEAGTITVNLDAGANLNPIQYCLNEGEWMDVIWNTPIPLAADDVISFRGNNGTCCVYIAGSRAGFHFECSNPCYVYGNMMSLIDQDGFATNTTLTETHAFYHLFETSDEAPNTTILNHPLWNIVLPATTLTTHCYHGLFLKCQGITRAPALPATTMEEYCYSEMFHVCTALTTPPVLPATTLAGYCYYNMFYGCTHLATAPALPATTLEDYCYSGMFAACTSLTAAPELPAPELKVDCYSDMFNGCTSLTTAPALPATTLVNNCYKEMFRACTNLTTAPELPATDLAEDCYYNMFNGCTKLTTAPAALPATTLMKNCYRGMFFGCTSLTTAPALPATTLEEYCYYGMFNGCNHLTTAPALPAATLSRYCYREMFKNCSNLNYVVCLATDISASYCVSNWLKDVAATGTFVKASSMSNWPSGNSGIPNGWTEKDIDEFTNNGNWNVAANWSNNAVPAAGSSVLISANATVPSGYVANAKCIIINEGKTLTIADGGQLIHDNAGVVATVQKEISGYTSDDDGWNFIASPVMENLVSAQVSGLIPANIEYDFYYLEEASSKWRNYKPNNEHSGFDVEHNKGYLYANDEGTTINFSGTLQPYVAAGVTINLANEGDGWNLVGNPFTFNAYANKSYYIINGRNIEPTTGGAIAPCTGIVVKATGDSETVTFTKNNPAANSNQGNLNIVVTEQVTTRDGASTGSMVDKAIVSFNEGSQLEKFVFNEGNAKLYIPQGQEEYAIATSEAHGEMPVNFRANENGQYTITVSPENVEMGYLHLIDNMTGADVDLLVTPNYTFTAKTSDYASRFRLVFSVFGDEDGDNENAPFAYFHNGEIVILANVCNASLQVVDVTGRVVVSCQGDAINRVSISGMTTGVYVLRLSNRDGMKTQKIVIW